MVLDVPLRVWGLFQIGATGHLSLFPAPVQKHILTFDLFPCTHFEWTGSEFTT